MKPGESILTGMRVWHESGKTAYVVSLVIHCGETREDGTIDTETKTEVRLSDGGLTISVPLEEFLKKYHRRHTGWEHMEALRLDPPVYEGPLRGHHCLKLGWNDIVVRIPDRPRTPRELYDHEKSVAVALTGSYTEYYEKFEATGWKLVLEPAL